MKIGSTIVLWVIAIVLVTAALLTHRFGSGQGDGREASARLLLASARLEPGAVTRITLVRPREGRLVFAQDEDGWRQVEPFVHPMDPFSMRELIGEAASLAVVEVIDAGAGEKSALGLEPPRAELRLESGDGEVSLKLGRRGIGGRAYVQIRGDERIYVVNQDLHERAVAGDVREWRDRTIFRNVGIDADGLEITSDGSRIVLTRRGRQWTMSEPVRSRVNETACDELFAALGRARCSGFILDEPDDLGRFGLAQPAGTVSVTTTRRQRQGEEVIEHMETQRLHVGARMGVSSEDRFGIVEGREVVIRLSEAVLRTLFRQPGDLVAATGSGVIPADVKAIRIDGPGGDFRLERDLDRWRWPDDGNLAVLAEVVETLLETLTQARAPEVQLAAPPRDLVVATITFFGYDARPLDTVRVVREQAYEVGPGRWALENGDNVLRIFSPELAIPLTPEAFGLPSSGEGVPGG